MNTVAQRKIPEEWTPEMWQAHVTEMEKRLSNMEQKIAMLEQPRVDRERYAGIGACLV